MCNQVITICRQMTLALATLAFQSASICLTFLSRNSCSAFSPHTMAGWSTPLQSRLLDRSRNCPSHRKMHMHATSSLKPDLASDLHLPWIGGAGDGAEGCTLIQSIAAGRERHIGQTEVRMVKTLKASRRSSSRTFSVSGVTLNTERSTFTTPGPRTSASARGTLP